MVYWYLCGSDLETSGGFASTDFEEMLRVTLPDRVTAVIETGGARTWHNENIGADGNYRFVYDSEGLRLVEIAPRSNMGDGDTLENFLEFCNTNYPADKRAVVFWNHGGGSVAGLMFDELFGYDSLSLVEMRKAFHAITPPSAENPPYELIGFDACLMASIDVVDSTKGLARYMVASQETEPALGWEFEGLFSALADDPSIDGYQLGMAICDSYYDACAENGMAENVTLSVIDLSYADRLMEAYHNIGAESLFHACANIAYFGEFGRASRNAVNYGGNDVWNGYANMIDLGDQVRRASALLPEYGQAFLDVLDECVVYMRNGKFRDRASGLSGYYNLNSDYDDFLGFADMSGNTPFRWFFEYQITGELGNEGARFVQDLMHQYAREEEFRPTNITAPVNLEGHEITMREDGHAVLNLGPDVASHLTGVYYCLAGYIPDVDYIIMLGRAIVDDHNADWDNGVFVDDFTGFWGSIDGVTVYMELTDRNADYKLYTVPILLNGEEYSLRVGYAISTGEYKILGASRGIDSNGMADRDLRMLQPGDIVEPLFYFLYDIYDEEEEYTAEPVDGISIVVTPNTSFAEMYMGEGMFIYIFEMIDIMGNSYLADNVAFIVEDGNVNLLQ